MSKKIEWKSGSNNRTIVLRTTLGEASVRKGYDGKYAAHAAECDCFAPATGKCLGIFVIQKEAKEAVYDDIVERLNKEIFHINLLRSKQ